MQKERMFLSYFFSATSQEGNSLGAMLRKNSAIIWHQKSKKENCPANRDAVKAVLMENILPVWVTAL